MSSIELLLFIVFMVVVYSVLGAVFTAIGIGAFVAKSLAALILIVFSVDIGRFYVRLCNGFKHAFCGQPVAAAA